MLITATITTACVTSDRKNTAVKDAARSSGKLAAYPLKATALK
jgi:hypothetical protein